MKRAKKVTQTKPAPNTVQVAFRLPRVLVAQLDEEAAAMMAAQPGMTITRTDVVRVLLMRALDNGGTRSESRRSSRS
jgi:hypothetical protein